MNEANEQTTLRAHLERIIYYNNENGYLIGVFGAGRERHTAVGYLLQPREGEEYSLNGGWTTHAKYGRQFAFQSAEHHLPVSEAGVEQYLSSGLIKGIGPALASRIVEHFGAKTASVINDDPDRLTEVEGIGVKKLAGIKTALASMREMQETFVFLRSHGLSTAHSIRLYKTYGRNVVAVLQQNPYQMIDDVPGIGFITADAIAAKMGVQEESLYRITAGIRYVLDDACRSAGHCFVPKEDLAERASQLLRIDEAKVERAVGQAEENGFIVNVNDRIFPAPLSDAEERSVRRLSALMRKGERPLDGRKLDDAVRRVEKRRGVDLDPKQRSAVVSAMLQPVTIVTGGPGTGKTLTVNGMIELADELGMRYVLCAPTGRAAKRLSEVSGRDAKTVHRLLEYDPNSGAFRKGEDDAVEADIVIVDEMSMVDIQLFAALLDAVPPEAQLVLVGDVDQLPSVGPGQVLHDLIGSGRLSVVRLTTVFRQASQSSIILNSHRINSGEEPEYAPDFRFIEADRPEEMQEHIVGLCSTVLPQNHRYDPFTDIQVLAPMNNGPAGVRELNKRLQQVLNGRSTVGWQGNDRRFLVRDKVMQLRNDYEKEVYNGDIGTVSGYDREEGRLFVEFDGRPVSYAFEELDALSLAYATTIHKSQGNEFDAVVIPLGMMHYIMLQRNLVYTAVSRARRHLFIVGQRKALAAAVRNTDARWRNTLLLQRLREGL